jgi:erythromycin esterase-like protein
MEMGFTVFAIEANMPEARRVNDYVADGRGDPAELIRGMYFWTWQTEEVRAMVEWMRRYNVAAAERGEAQRIEFTGFDMQELAVAAGIVREHVARTDPAFLPAVDDAIRAATAANQKRTGFANTRLPAELLRGHRVVLSGWIRTEDVTNGWAGFWLSTRVAGRSRPAYFANMAANGPRGTKSWARYEIVTDVPADAEWVGFGMMLTGQGAAWFDDLAFTVDGRPFDPGPASDFSFEGPAIAGFDDRSEAGYRVQLAPIAHSGRQGLHIASVGSAAAELAHALQLWRQCGEHLGAITSSQPPAELAWARQNARIVSQSLGAKEQPKRRDEFMADNIDWLLEQNPQAKIILWAHNGHIARADGAMGGHLAKRHGESLCVIGFATGTGKYRAFAAGEAKFAVLPLQSPPPDSIESVFAAAGLPIFALDLRPARRATGPEKWFAEKHLHRIIGSGEMKQQFSPREMGREFDAMIWIARTSASVMLPGAE